MTFERTREGQRNRALFYGVDFICYVEGDDGADQGDDVYFWSSVFRSVWPNRSAAFLCRGGKPQLEKLAREVVNENVEGVVVAMDADYAGFFEGKVIDDPRVLYTFGYSWENDVFGPETTLESHRSLCTRADIPDPVCDEHRRHWDLAAQFLLRMTKADFGAFRAGGSIIDAQKPGKHVGRDTDGYPVFRRDLFLATLTAENARLRPRSMKECIGVPNDGIRYVKGRVLALVSRYIATSCAKLMSNIKSVSEAHYRHVCLDELCAHIKNDAPMLEAARHHKMQIDRLGQSLIFS